jgi:hypothetical protein
VVQIWASWRASVTSYETVVAITDVLIALIARAMPVAISSFCTSSFMLYLHQADEHGWGG